VPKALTPNSFKEAAIVDGHDPLIVGVSELVAAARAVIRPSIAGEVEPFVSVCGGVPAIAVATHQAVRIEVF